MCTHWAAVQIEISNINCYCHQCCHTLVITDYSLCTSCPGRPYCSVGLWWWVKGGGLGWQDTRHASSVFKTSSWQAVASYRWGPNDCGSDTNHWQLYVNMILCYNWSGLYIFSVCAAFPNMELDIIWTLARVFSAPPVDVSSGIINSSVWVDACVCVS